MEINNRIAAFKGWNKVDLYSLELQRLGFGPGLTVATHKHGSFNSNNGLLEVNLIHDEEILTALALLQGLEIKRSHDIWY